MVEFSSMEELCVRSMALASSSGWALSFGEFSWPGQAASVLHAENGVIIEFGVIACVS